MISLGGALLLIFILYLIDKHSLWMVTAKIAACVLIVGALTVGGFLIWERYTTKRATAATSGTDQSPAQSSTDTPVDCYDAQGNLLPDGFKAFGGFETGCGKGETAKPKSERANVPAEMLHHVERIEACEKKAVDQDYAGEPASVSNARFDKCKTVK